MVPLDPVIFVRVSPSGKNPERLDKTSSVISLVYEDETKKADKLTLTVDNYDLSNFDAPIWKTGNSLEVSWGYDGNMCHPRQMLIQKVTGSVLLKVEALDHSVLMNKVHNVRTFDYVSRSDVAKQIALEYGWGPPVQHIDDTEDVFAQITQGRFTDLGLLRDMAKLQHWDFYVDFDGFHFHPPRTGDKPKRKFIYFTDPGRGDILTWNIENDIYGASKTAGVKVVAVDPKTKKLMEVLHDASTAVASAMLAPEAGLVLAVIGGTPQKISGAPAQAAALVQLQDTEAKARAALEAVVPATVPTAAGVKKQAANMHAAAALQAAKLVMECVGDPQMLGKMVIEIQGIGKTISGNYFVNSVHHKVGAGYTMTVKASRTGPSSSTTSAGQGFKKSVPKPPVTPAGPVNDSTYDATLDPNSVFYNPAQPVLKVDKGKITYGSSR